MLWNLVLYIQYCLFRLKLVCTQSNLPEHQQLLKTLTSSSLLDQLLLIISILYIWNEYLTSWQTRKQSSAVSFFYLTFSVLLDPHECKGPLFSSSMSTAGPAESVFSKELHSGAWRLSSSTASSASSFCTVSSTRWRQMFRETHVEENRGFKLHTGCRSRILFYFITPSFWTYWRSIG